MSSSVPLSIYYTNGVDPDVTYYFDNEVDMADWNALVLEIKARSRYIYEHGEEGRARELQYQRWLQFVDQFRNRFGNNKVPLDIARAYNSVVEGLRM